MSYKNTSWFRAPEKSWVRPEEFKNMVLRLPVVLINGAFDLLHCGHLRVIALARHKAGSGTVIVALDSDDRVAGNKGPGRPILSWIERAAMFNYLPVDIIVEIEDDEDMKTLIEGVQPDLRVQGGDYARHSSKFPGVKKIFVSNRGAHTSEIIRRIRGNG